MKLHWSITVVTARSKTERAFTLPELLVAVAIGALILTAVAATTVSSVRSFASMYSYADLDMDSRTALDTLSRDIRGATNVASASTSSLVLNCPSNTVITYSWDSSANTVTRYKKDATGSSSKTTLTKCNNWKVTMYTKTRTVTTTPAQCKMIAVNWKCWRKVVGVQQTDNAQEAMIILRNK